MFSERSYDEIPIDEVAQRAGISKGLLYHYFRGKRDFYIATVQFAADELTSYLTPDPSLDAVAQVNQGVDRYLRYVEKKAASYVSLMRSGIGADPELEAVVATVRQRLMELVLSRTPGKESPARRVAVRGWVGFVEAASLDWLQHKDLDREQLRDLCVRMLLASIAASLKADAG